VITLNTGEASAEAVAKLTIQGYGAATTYNDSIPSIPDDLTDIDDQELMKLFQHFVEYNNFLLLQISCARIDEEAATKVLERFEASKMLDAVKGETVARTKAKTASDPVGQKLDDELAVRRNYHTLLKSIQDGVNESTKVISRELSRRTANPGFTSRKF
jgi:hypothetical protein